MNDLQTRLESLKRMQPFSDANGMLYPIPVYRQRAQNNVPNVVTEIYNLQSYANAVLREYRASSGEDDIIQWAKLVLGSFSENANPNTNA